MTEKCSTSMTCRALKIDVDVRVVNLMPQPHITARPRAVRIVALARAVLIVHYPSNCFTAGSAPSDEGLLLSPLPFLLVALEHGLSILYATARAMIGRGG